MKKLINIFVLSSMLLFFNNVFAASVSEIKVEINTFRMLLENETITQEQFDIIAGGALESLDEYKSLKKLFDAKILDYSQFWDSINKILGIAEGDSSSASSSSSGKSEKELLSEAIGSIQSISSDTATKDKLELYETAINNISKIESNHPGSDTAIKLKTNQDIGDFSITKIRKDYLDELLGYYDIVCEKSPSYVCLGFVSLKTGQEMCKTGSGFDELDTAHESLLNAVRIFKGQKTNSAYSSIALASYRSCNKNIQGASKAWSYGYYAMPLVRTLLDIGDEKTARGIIENVDDPYFKFLSALYFKVASGETPDLAYSDRLKEFIEQKIKPESIDASLSKLALSKMMLVHSNDAFIIDDFYYAYDSRITESLGCGGFLMNYFHEEYIDLLFLLYEMDKGRFASQNVASWGYQFPIIAKKIGNNRFRKCPQKVMSLQLLGDLLIFNGLEDANKYREFVINGDSGNKTKLFDYYVDLRLANNEVNITFAPFPHNETNSVVSSSQLLGELRRGSANTLGHIYEMRDDDKFGKGDNLKRVNGNYEFEKFSKILYLERFSNANKLGIDSTYKVFQSYVDFANVCKSSEMLFQQLKGTEYYQDAVNYMVSSPRLDPNKKYSCGDENLELLLN